MSKNLLVAVFKPKTILVIALFMLCGSSFAQQVSLALLQPSAIEPVIPAKPVKTIEPLSLPEAPHHRFWDRENTVLFAANAGFTTADFVITRQNLQHGGQELNPVTRVFAGSTAGLAVNFAGEMAGVVGISYVFHKTGHHKLERAVSILNLGSSAGAVSFDLMRR